LFNVEGGGLAVLGGLAGGFMDPNGSIIMDAGYNATSGQRCHLVLNNVANKNHSNGNSYGESLGEKEAILISGLLVLLAYVWKWMFLVMIPINDW